MSIVSGAVSLQAEGPADKRPPGWTIGRGDTVLLPFAGAYTFAADSTTILLITENFV